MTKKPIPKIGKDLLTFLFEDLLSDGKDAAAFGVDIAKNKTLSKLLLRGMRPQVAFKDTSKPHFNILIEQTVLHPEIILIAYNAHSRLPEKGQIATGKSFGAKRIDKYFKDQGVAAGLWKCLLDPDVSEAGHSRGIEIATVHLSALPAPGKNKATPSTKPIKGHNSDTSAPTTTKMIIGLEKQLSKLKEKYDASLAENENLRAAISKRQSDKKAQEKQSVEREKILTEVRFQITKIENDLEIALKRDKNNTALHLKKEEKLSNSVLMLRKGSKEDKDQISKLKAQTEGEQATRNKLSAKVTELSQTIENITRELEVSKQETIAANSRTALKIKAINLPGDLADIRKAGLSAIRSEATLEDPDVRLIEKLAIFVKSAEGLLSLDQYASSENFGGSVALDDKQAVSPQITEIKAQVKTDEIEALITESHEALLAKDVNAEWDAHMAQLRSARKHEQISNFEMELFGDETPELIVVDGHNVAFKMPVSGEKKSRKKLIALLDNLVEEREINVIVYFDTKYSFANNDNGGAQVRYCPKRAGGADPEILTELNFERDGSILFVSDDEHIKAPVSSARAEGQLVDISGTSDFINYLMVLVN